MIRFLLGVAVGAIATASYLSRRGSFEPIRTAGGRVDELSTAANNLIVDDEVNAGDGTPSRHKQENAMS
ncbi:MAG TPA: hypothetical protein VJU53_04750 [Burkholderiaceae bacterium]|nr:hypothetical protein [Burkholderiaceae bacterium]